MQHCGTTAMTTGLADASGAEQLWGATRCMECMEPLLVTMVPADETDDGYRETDDVTIRGEALEWLHMMEQKAEALDGQTDADADTSDGGEAWEAEPASKPHLPRSASRRWLTLRLAVRALLSETATEMVRSSSLKKLARLSPTSARRRRTRMGQWAGSIHAKEAFEEEALSDTHTPPRTESGLGRPDLSCTLELELPLRLPRTVGDVTRWATETLQDGRPRLPTVRRKLFSVLTTEI